MPDRVEDAPDPREFAVAAHGDQLYGERPYVAHLDAVAEIVRTVDESSDASTVAYLHDVVEDTSVTLMEIYETFGPRVATAVLLLTDPEGPNRRARKAELHRRLATLDPTGPAERLALLVKAADRLSNVSSSLDEGKDGLLKMYRKEHDDFRRATFRPGLCDDLWAQIDDVMRARG